jgi:hypothetical protein
MKNLKSYDGKKMKMYCGVHIFRCSCVKPSRFMEVFLDFNVMHYDRPVKQIR